MKREDIRIRNPFVLAHGNIRSMEHIETPIFDNNGGHPMVFTNLEGRKIICIHQPERWFDERLCYFKIDENKF